VIGNDWRVGNETEKPIESVEPDEGEETERVAGIAAPDAVMFPTNSIPTRLVLAHDVAGDAVVSASGSLLV
jgi:hypothetical protein